MGPEVERARHGGPDAPNEPPADATEHVSVPAVLTTKADPVAEVGSVQKGTVSDQLDCVHGSRVTPRQLNLVI